MRPVWAAVAVICLSCGGNNGTPPGPGSGGGNGGGGTQSSAGGSNGDTTGGGSGNNGGGTNIEGSGGGTQSGACDVQSCPSGCCTGSVCNAGTENSACGTGGHACTTCGSGLACVDQVCKPAAQQQCDATTCPNGCCKNNQCVLGSDVIACGSGGNTCAQCASGDACTNHACISSTGGCDSQSCPSGCCSGTQCLTGNDNAACGASGGVCDACSGSETCTNHACVAPVVCNAQTCPTGCCQNGQCVSGTADSACGTTGHTCLQCGSGNACTNHACKPMTTTCDANSCPNGCCSSTGQCLLGTTTSACGSGGASCHVCSSGNSCVDQACASVGGSCDATSCPNGCCQNGQCVAGTDTTACGSGGAACDACGALQLCLFGGCYDLTGSCGPQSCNGCCSQGACLPGTDTNACGTGGNSCSACNSLLGCVGGTCLSLGGGNDGGAVGSACTQDNQCASGNDIFGFDLPSCISPTISDGGVSGWPGGYCSPTCYFASCPGDALCLGSYCYESCPSPGSGRSNCRAQYACEYQQYSDGGFASGYPGYCQPDCHAPGNSCLNGTHCNSLGYCR